ncbi:MAG: nuclear transport factor 2 family protein [Nevskiaceae bacterium]|nr:MAG: nuclear transport factor 2 family protein [Nevskiaceae bacterium]
MQNDKIEQRLRALESAEAIRSLKARYFFACDRKDPATMRDCFVDGPVHIDYGVIGTFDNADTLVQLYTQMACHPHMVEMHHGANPQIEVIDDTRAQGTWSLHYCLINTQQNSFTQLGGYYEDEYRRTPSGWKISRTRFVATSTLALDLSAGDAKVLFAGSKPPAA